jgi:hypothetical protein
MKASQAGMEMSLIVEVMLSFNIQRNDFTGQK